MKRLERRVRISEEALSFALEAAKASHPNEFVGLLREEEGAITHILLIPGSISNENSAWLDYLQVPAFSGSCGTVHSHPGPDNRPSDADLQLFSRSGSVHAIISYPYTEKTVQFYDGEGRKISFQIV